MRYTPRLLVTIVVSVSVINFLWFYLLGAFTAPPASVIVLKLPRSGSSWFTELLNNDPETYISKEIIQSGDKLEFSEFEKEQHLAKALVRPTDKISSSKDFLPSGRFVEDFIAHKTHKWLNTLRAVGFTLNVEHCLGVNWNMVIEKAAIHRTKLIIFSRSNMVKTAISAARGEELKKICGLSNIKQDRSDCVLPPTYTVSVAALLNRTIFWQDRYDAFHREIGAIPHVQHLEVTYEALQANTPQTMQRVHEFITGEPAADSFHLRAASTEGNVWVKRSPDDLSLLLSDFAAINAQLTHPACANFKQQLNDVKFTVFVRDAWQNHAAADFRTCLASLK